MSRDELAACQSRRLRELVQSVYHGVPFYRDKMQRLGMMPEDIRSIEDLATLPFTTKSDLRDNYPFGLFGVPLDQIVRLHASSGTTGRPLFLNGSFVRLISYGSMLQRSPSRIR